MNGVRRYLEGNTIVLKPKERDICILFSAPDFISGENGRFFYQLNGVNNSWREAGKDRRAVYYGLAHGSYTFLLAYRNSSGIRNPENLEFHFKILPYWYETTLARMIAVLLLAALLTFFIMRLLAKKKQEYQGYIYTIYSLVRNGPFLKPSSAPTESSWDLLCCRIR